MTEQLCGIKLLSGAKHQDKVRVLGSLHLSIMTSTAVFFAFPGKMNSLFSQEEIIFNCLLVVFLCSFY